MLRLKGFGPAIIERDGQPLEGAARQRRVVALLTLVASARDRGISRDRLLALLWPESDTERARQSLTQALYHARRALGCEDLFIAAADIRLNPQVITADLWDFADAFREHRFADAVELQSGSLLEGFFLTGAPEFERWLADERSRLASQLADALESLAVAADAQGDFVSAIAWRRQRAALEPMNSRYAVALLLSLERRGDRTAALQHARVHEALLRQEFDLPLPQELSEIIERIRLESVSPAEKIVETGPSGEVLSEPELAVADPESSGDPESPRAAGDPGGASAADSQVVTGTLRAKHRRGRYAVAFIAAAIAVAAVVASFIPRSAPPMPADTLIVAPFRVSGAEASLAYLREGLVDLLSTKLGEDSSARIADAGTVMAAWHHAGVDVDASTSRGEVLSLARRLGASRLLLGSVVGTSKHLVLNALLLGVADTRLIAQASVEGPSDSLTTLVDRLAVRLIATQAGAGDRLADQTTTSARALRAYLTGRAAYRRGRYREAIQQFRAALTADATFALAGLGLAQAGDRVGAAADVSRGLRTAWAARSDLVERDRVYLEGLAGPRYPEPSSERERLEAWERAATAAPDRAEVWHELGKRLFHDGRLIGVGEWRQRALAAFHRAVELDSGFASPLQYLVQLAAAGGDTSEVRRTAAAYLRIDSLGDLAGFVRWRASIALGDSARLRRVRQSFATMPSASLRTIALSSVANGIAIEDAQRALAVLRSRAARAAERGEILLAEHALALDRGKLDAARNVLRSLESAPTASAMVDRLRILDALYGPTGASTADSAGVRMTLRVERHLSAREPTRGDSVAIDGLREDVCAVGQWRAWRGDSGQASTLAGHLAASSDRSDRLSALCAALIKSIVAIGAKAPEAPMLLARYDSMLTSGSISEPMRGYAQLALARLYAAWGDDRRALQMARRRTHLSEWPRYLASQLREEGRLAVVTRDTAGAIRAYQHYLSLRGNADDRVRPEVLAVQTELDRLASNRK